MHAGKDKEKPKSLDKEKPKSTNTLRTNTTSRHAYDAAAYSASAELKATTLSWLEVKHTGAPMK